ncbi:VOC family protein [Sinorhizobium sp. BG8]|uniref:VOC family protein n=1 Tax=Sinorhizobium sp. BG8 TaxID=2613773 RepID=UPI00193CDBE0|nr:VOC family protein [Sinorhizobium sp. BG8]QRM56692.1 VOC family protein [Sinorhizobium sp. BG8]
MTKHQGRFVWYELMTSDISAAENFYKSVVGWSAKDAGMPDMKYTIVSAGERMIAGLMTTPKEAEGMPPAWIGYIYADDVDATAKEIAAKGGKVHRQPDDIPNIGRFAVVADPHGAIFSIFSSASEGEPPADPMSPGHVGWHELMAGDLESAWSFYAQLFGWTKDEALDMGEMGTYQLFKINDQTAGGMMTKPKDLPAPPYWGFYFTVDAIDSAIERVNAGGGKVVMGPMEVPGGAWIINGVDPQGAYFSLVAPKR